jgi:predicted glycoside hydrolase/deacetylase ChbG (UPF0249 family)
MTGRVLAHLDDVGVTAGSVTAWRDLRRAGVVRSASVMVPCPWYPAAVADWRAEPDQDLGVHLTLTSEWAGYRWRPMIGPVRGLVDADGFLHRRPEMVAGAADPSAVEDELAAQIERALSDGLRPSHLDAHMGTAFLGPFIRPLLDVAARYGLPTLVCRDFSTLFGMVGARPDPGALAELVAEGRRRGWPVFDRFVMGFAPEGADAAAFFAGLLRPAREGLTWFALHADAGPELAAVAPHMAGPRAAEHRLFADPAARAAFGPARVIAWPELTLSGTAEEAARCA